MTINSFDELTSFKDGEDYKYLVEYVLADDGGFCHRCSPFLMQKGTVFEHNYGTYKVVSIDRKLKHIVLHCERIDNKTPMFDTLFKMSEVACVRINFEPTLKYCFLLHHFPAIIIVQV